MKKDKRSSHSQRLNHLQEITLSKQYSKSLLESGYPSNTHVYDINMVYLKPFLHKKDAMFLSKVRTFFFSLPYLEGLILVNDCLEKGKNYPFWWMQYGNEDFIAKERRKFQCHLKQNYRYLMAEE